MRKFLIALVLMLAVFFLLTRVAELHQVMAILQRGSLPFLGLAMVIEVAWILNLGAFYKSIYRVLGMHVRHRHAIKLATAGYFLSVVAPSAGLSAMAVFFDDAKRHGRSTARVTVVGILYVWFEYIGTLGISVLGLGELSRRNDLHWPEIAASLILLAGALLIGLVLYLSTQSSPALGKVLAGLTRLVNFVVRPFIHRDYLKEARAYAFSEELTEGITVLHDNPRWIYWPFFFTFMNKALLVAVLASCFLAFQLAVDPGTVVAGQSIAHLFLIVSPTPAGIGIVEGILALALKSLGMPLSDATVVTLAYRAFSFWTPFFFGMVMFRFLGRGKKNVIKMTG